MYSGRECFIAHSTRNVLIPSYLGVSGLGMVVALAFILTKLPEVSEESLQAEAEAAAHAEGTTGVTSKPFWQQWRAISGFVAQCECNDPTPWSSD